MDLLTFIVEIAKALAWPISLLACLVVVRGSVQELIRNLTRFKFSELELEFSSTLETARTLLAEQVDDTTSDIDFIESRSLSPRAIILESWLKIEQVINRLHENISEPRNQKSTNSRKIRKLQELNVLNEAEVSSVSLLRNLRNQAAHDESFVISKSEALEYATLANSFIKSKENSLK